MAFFKDHLTIRAWEESHSIKGQTKRTRIEHIFSKDNTNLTEEVNQTTYELFFMYFESVFSTVKNLRKKSIICSLRLNSIF